MWKKSKKTIGFADSLQLLETGITLIRDLEGVELKDTVHRRLNDNRGTMSPEE